MDQPWFHSLVVILMSSFMFDPFNDFEIAGYLRNVRKDKDKTKIKHFEHDLFRANLDSALTYLATKRVGEWGKNILKGGSKHSGMGV